MKRANPFFALAPSSSEDEDEDKGTGFTVRTEEQDGDRDQSPRTSQPSLLDRGLTKKNCKKRRKEDRRKALKLAARAAATEDGLMNADDIISQKITAALQATSSRSGNLSGRVSAAFEQGQTLDAFALLVAMRQLKQCPRLGTVQRWVATLGDAASTDPTALGLLYAILRVANGLGVSLGSSTSKEGGEAQREPLQSANPEASSTPTGTRFALAGKLKRLDDWAAVPLNSNFGAVAAPAPVAGVAGCGAGGAGVTWKTPVSEDPNRNSSTKGGSGGGANAAEATTAASVLAVDPESAVAPVDYRARFRILATIPGADRTPPNRHDLRIYESASGALAFDSLDARAAALKAAAAASASQPVALTPCQGVVEAAASPTAAAAAVVVAAERGACARIDVPFASGAFVVPNVLSRSECRRVIAAAEQLGFVPDEPSSRTAALVAATSAGLNDRAANFTWLADDSLQDRLLERCLALLPQRLEADGAELAGINPRWRLYRYFPGAVYRPHVDGAWPASGKRPLPRKSSGSGSHGSGCGGAGGRSESGGGGGRGEVGSWKGEEDGSSGEEYVYDDGSGRRSRLTMLVYLNEGFQGGCTTYFTPSSEEEGVVNARGVAPREGMVLFFPHGEGSGSLVHEGSALVAGTKYVLRTDVLFRAPLQQPKRPAR